MKRKREEKKERNFKNTLSSVIITNAESMICLLTSEIRKDVYHYLLESIAKMASRKLLQSVKFMIERKVSSEIIYDFMLELGKMDFGDLRDNETAEVFMASVSERSRKTDCLLPSFELFWKNPLFFNVTRNFRKVAIFTQCINVTHRCNILATIYKELVNLYKKEEEHEDKDFLYNNAINYTQRQLQPFPNKQVSLLRLNVSLDFLRKNSRAVKEELRKLYRPLLFEIFKKYSPLLDVTLIDKNIMPFL